MTRKLSKSSLPSIKEPHGLLRSDNKRPVGLTPYSMGRWSLRYLGRHFYWHCGSLSPERIICLCMQPQQLKRRPNASEITMLKSRAIIISFPSPSSHSVLLIRSVRTSSLLWAIAFHQSLMTHEINFSFSDAFLLRFNRLMLSASPTRSAILMWKRDVTSRDTTSSWFFPASQFLMPLGMEYQGRIHNNNNN